MIDMFRYCANGDSFPVAEVPFHDIREFLQGIITATGYGWRVQSLFGTPEEEGIGLYVVLGYRAEAKMAVMRSRVRDHFPSITNLCPQVHLFEREIAEQWGIIPERHPWFKPVRYHKCRVNGADAWKRGADEAILPCVTDFYRVEGDEIHDVAVGPVHAGIIEPGHFRFQCHGEHVFHLEIALGYQHRGIEELLLNGPHPASIHQIETIAGDTTVGHAQAWCMIMESYGGASVPGRADYIRGIALELERLANHTGDLGALANDVGFLPTSSYCGRIRGDFLNLTALICGNRFGRGLLRPGGVMFDIEETRVHEFRERLSAARRDLTNAVELMFHTPSVLARFEHTGTVTRDTAKELGLVGFAARASNVRRDVRADFPFGAYASVQCPVASLESGDVLARARVRWLECRNSLDYIERLLDRMPAGSLVSPASTPPAPDTIAIAVTEGWRGEICHAAITGGNGRFRCYKIKDPSFHNWTGLAMALRNQQISDFPLCNKSFNLSYCGFDL